MVRHLVPALGRARLQSLTPPMLKAAYRALLDDKGLSPSTVQLVHQVLSKALSDAVADGLLPHNRAAKVKAPARSTVEMSTWSADQAAAFLRHVEGERLGALWRLFLTTGLRRGEVAALRWQDVDLDRAALSVRQTGNLIGGVWVVGTPKGRKDASAKTRRLALDGGTVEALRRHRAAQLQERLAWAGDWQDHGLVFAREDGSPLNPSTIGQQLTVRARQAGLPHGRVHDSPAHVRDPRAGGRRSPQGRERAPRARLDRDHPEPLQPCDRGLGPRRSRSRRWALLVTAEVPGFFVPAASTPEEAERVYGQLAALCGRTAPPPSQRVRRIVWIHDGEEWTAEVGKPLRGMQVRRGRRRGVVQEIRTPISDAATALAIFPGVPYMVVTNGPGIGDVRSQWANPFLAGQPTRVDLFPDSSG